jgi:hypothetical protein
VCQPLAAVDLFRRACHADIGDRVRVSLVELVEADRREDRYQAKAERHQASQHEPGPFHHRPFRTPRAQREPAKQCKQDEQEKDADEINRHARLAVWETNALTRGLLQGGLAPFQLFSPPVGTSSLEVPSGPRPAYERKRLTS